MHGSLNTGSVRFSTFQQRDIGDSVQQGCARDLTDQDETETLGILSKTRLRRDVLDPRPRCCVTNCTTSIVLGYLSRYAKYTIQNLNEYQNVIHVTLNTDQIILLSSVISSHSNLIVCLTKSNISMCLHSSRLIHVQNPG